MPDLVGYKVTPLASASVTVPRATVEAKIVDSSTGAVLFDFTGANAVTFPNILATLTAPQRLQLLEMIAIWLLQNKAGLA